MLSVLLEKEEADEGLLIDIRIIQKGLIQESYGPIMTLVILRLKTSI